MDTGNHIIQTFQLTHHYGDVVAVKDVNLEVHEGEVFGFLGPNGAGKTTTIRMLLDFIRPTAGSAHIFGRDVREQGVAIRQHVGFLPSELTLWKNMTGTRYIRWMSKLYRKDLMPEAQALAERLQYDLGRSLGGMSTGMKRKMGLIASLAHKPRVLILDEPTLGLDPLMQEVFLEIVLEAKAEGRTVFMSSHSLSEVERVCDRVGIIRDGALQEVESVGKLTHVTFRWMSVTYEQPVSPEELQGMEGVSDLTTEDSTLRMKISGHADLDAILRQVLTHHVVDLQFETPNLEEIFLSYYGTRSQ